MRVKDIMKKDYLALRVDDSLEKVLEAFADAEVTSAPVFDHGEFVGIMSSSDIARHCLPKEMLWPSAQSESGILIAGKIARKPLLTLTPDQPLSLVCGKIASTSDCVPVVENKAVVGIVTCLDLTEYYLAEIAKHDLAEQMKKGAGKKKESSDEEGTDIDRILEIVRREGETSPAKVAAELGISQKTVGSLARSLARHHLMEVHFSFLSGMVMRRMEHGKK